MLTTTPTTVLKGQVTLTHASFQQELRSQKNWPAAVAREIVQNSKDAGASRLEFRTFDDDPDRIEAYDDGCGFTVDTLTKFFTDSWSSKHDDPNSVGGFGAARRLLCWAQQRYRIESRNLVATGTGPDCEVVEHDDVDENHPDWVHGTRLTIWLAPTGGRDGITSPDRVVRELRSLMYGSHLRPAGTGGNVMQVFTDGSRLYQASRPDRAKKVLKDTDGRPWARVYVVPNEIGYVRVRAGGLLMFNETSLPGSTDYVLELEPRRVLELLTVHRDGLTQPYHDQFMAFVRQLETDRRNALKPPTPPLRQRVGVGRMTTTVLPEEPDTDLVDEASEKVSAFAPTPQLDLTATTEVDATSAQDKRQAQIEEQARADAAKRSIREPGAPLTDAQVDDILDRLERLLPSDVYLLADSNDTRVKQLTRRWSPQYWDESTGAQRRALLLTWHAACEEAVKALLQVRPDLGAIAWTVGWTFDQDVRAVCNERAEGAVLALNPVDADGRTRYRLSGAAGTKDMRKLLTYAMHEAAHIGIDGHNEAYASQLTDMWGVADQGEIIARMRAAR